MEEEGVGTNQRIADSLSDILQSESFHQDAKERAENAFEKKTPVEMVIAGLWPDNDPIWESIRGEIPTPDWHGTATDIRPLVRTHVLRLVKGWKNESAAVRYFESRPHLIRDFGYDTFEEVEQSKLWRAWNKRYSETLKQAIEETADILVREARKHSVPAPDEAFRPSEQTTDSPSERTERELISKNTKEVWQQAKPFIEDSFYLHRGENTEIPEGAWWEQHTYLGMRKNMFAESGADCYRDETDRDRVPIGRHHRDKIKMLSVGEIRKMVRNATRTLVARARHNSELVGNLTVAIDITKGHPWTGEIERRENGVSDESHILGYKDGDRHFQWATIQVVGHDIPLVLDAIPTKRGLSRHNLVDRLLETATDMVGGIELVMMDREFDTDSVKDVCDKHGVYYLNPARKHTSERAKCTRLRRAGKLINITEEHCPDSPNRKRIYLPSKATDIDPAVVDDEELLDSDPPDEGEEEDDEGEKLTPREEMMADLEEIGGDVSALDSDRPIGQIIDEMYSEEEAEVTVGNATDKQAYALFETNHPMVEAVDSHDESSKIHMAERMVRRYRHRWGIENGFKKIKTFMVRSASKDYRYRFFNFAFACVLYNVWRLVDLLVKLAIDGEYATYAPKVDANRFLTHAKKYYGIPPPK